MILIIIKYLLFFIGCYITLLLLSSEYVNKKYIIISLILIIIIITYNYYKGKKHKLSELFENNNKINTNITNNNLTDDNAINNIVDTHSQLADNDSIVSELKKIDDTERLKLQKQDMEKMQQAINSKQKSGYADTKNNQLNKNTSSNNVFLNKDTNTYTINKNNTMLLDKSKATVDIDKNMYMSHYNTAEKKLQEEKNKSILQLENEKNKIKDLNIDKPDPTIFTNENVYEQYGGFIDANNLYVPRDYTYTDDDYGYNFIPPLNWLELPGGVVPRVPLCVSANGNCKVNAALTSGYPINLKDWHESRKAMGPDGIDLQYIQDHLNTVKPPSENRT